MERVAALLGHGQPRAQSLGKMGQPLRMLRRDEGPAGPSRAAEHAGTTSTFPWPLVHLLPYFDVPTQVICSARLPEASGPRVGVDWGSLVDRCGQWKHRHWAAARNLLGGFVLGGLWAAADALGAVELTGTLSWGMSRAWSVERGGEGLPTDRGLTH